MNLVQVIHTIFFVSLSIGNIHRVTGMFKYINLIKCLEVLPEIELLAISVSVKEWKTF